LWYYHLIEQLRIMHKSIGLHQMARSMFTKKKIEMGFFSKTK
jgi:hypothetical protein